MNDNFWNTFLNGVIAGQLLQMLIREIVKFIYAKDDDEEPKEEKES